MVERVAFEWINATQLPPHRYTCGYCGEDVAPNRGYYTSNQAYPAHIYICHVCNRPTLIFERQQFPGAPYGDSVSHLPVDVDALYREARNSMAVSAYTGAVLLCRKVLMNVAVSLGAPTNQSFLEYVNYLATNNYIPPNARGWVDHIRRKGNEATHEIHLMSPDDAKELIGFTEMLLKIVYEFPNRVPGASTSTTPPTTPVTPPITPSP